MKLDGLPACQPTPHYPLRITTQPVARGVQPAVLKQIQARLLDPPTVVRPIYRLAYLSGCLVFDYRLQIVRRPFELVITKLETPFLEIHWMIEVLPLE